MARLTHAIRYEEDDEEKKTKKKNRRKAIRSWRLSHSGGLSQSLRLPLRSSNTNTRKHKFLGMSSSSSSFSSSPILTRCGPPLALALAPAMTQRSAPSHHENATTRAKLRVETCAYVTSRSPSLVCCAIFAPLLLFGG
ncbi:hypothetical protein L596_030369 [Steinernema carpocapsae]|uniref:Uncharacterized protein n=1 Tax=Steinernema carpocapsae TaxID=34508 RepID=A0A4U5LP68_STECR|nr:hypothetical protein L596_030369 [Steinernema carpocapsae]